MANYPTDSVPLDQRVDAVLAIVKEPGLSYPEP
jgi:hypothetical protein